MLAHRPQQVSSGTINAYSASSQQKTIMRSDTTKKRRPDHSGSKLLTSAENQLLFENLGQNRISLVAGIVQLLRANHGQWQHVHVGVVSLVKDYERKLYALILFDIYTGNKLWEQILYKNFTVKDYPKCRKLLSFESDDYVCGLNFSDETEAANFKHHLDKRHDAERGQKDPRGSIKASHHHHQAPAPQPQSTPKQTYNQPTTTYDQKFQSPGFTGVGSTPHFSVSHNTAPTPPPTKDKKKQKEQKKKKTKISKEDIGYPTNFEHKAHLGWDTDGGFSQHTSAEPMDESVRKLLQVAGQNPDIMSHEELSFASKFIKDYKETAVAPPIPQSTYPQSTLSRNNGRSQGFSMAPMTHQQPAPQIQQHVPAATHYGTGPTTQVYHYQTQQHSYPSNDHVAMPPPPPGRDSSIYTPQRQQQQPVRPPPIERPQAPVYQEKPSYERSYQPPVISSNAPPPPPPMTAKTTTTVQINHPPAPQQSRPGPPPPPPPPTQTAKPAAAKSSANAPPAPPPPPMLNTAAAATPSSNGSVSLPPAQDGRANLLAQIQQGAKLKHVTAPVEKSGFAKGEAKGNDRDQMMEQIKQGAQLKHVDATEVENRKSVPNVQEIGGIAGALARALEERRKNMNVSDESDNDEDNDSEWDAD